MPKKKNLFRFYYFFLCPVYCPLFLFFHSLIRFSSSFLCFRLFPSLSFRSIPFLIFLRSYAFIDLLPFSFNLFFIYLHSYAFVYLRLLFIHPLFRFASSLLCLCSGPSLYLHPVSSFFFILMPSFIFSFHSFSFSFLVFSSVSIYCLLFLFLHSLFRFASSLLCLCSRPSLYLQSVFRFSSFYAFVYGLVFHFIQSILFFLMSPFIPFSFTPCSSSSFSSSPSILPIIFFFLTPNSFSL